MIYDFLKSDTEQLTTKADVCIIGAGAAGIALALAFVGSQHRVTVIESGGFDYEDDTQLLAAGECIGRAYYQVINSRLRMLGGSTNHWQGECAPLDAIDFEQRPWVPYSGWPITLEELEPWYTKAQSLMKLGDFDYDPHEIKPADTESLTFDYRRIQRKNWRHSRPPLLFGATFSDALQLASNVDVHLHANFVGFDMDSNARRITGVRFASLAGHRGYVQATVCVLAAGGLENPRILLNSMRDVGRVIGNSHDLVGRFFMEHVNIVAGEMLTTNDNWRAEFGPVQLNDEFASNRLVLSARQQKADRVLNSAASLASRGSSRARSLGYGALHKIKQDLVRGQIPDRLGHHISRILNDLPGVVSGLLERHDESLWVAIEGEQAPNPKSRVLLSDQRDQLGMQRLALDWHLSEIDIQTMQRLLYHLGHEFGRLGYGRLRREPALLHTGQLASQIEVQGGYHHMGTTRMGQSETEGVVDSNAKVFDTDNLFIAGSSIFPTGGCANPTLTIVALTLRLAEHLQRHVL